MKFYKTLALIVLVGAFFAGSADAAQDQPGWQAKFSETSPDSLADSQAT